MLGRQSPNITIAMLALTRLVVASRERRGDGIAVSRDVRDWLQRL